MTAANPTVPLAANLDGDAVRRLSGHMRRLVAEHGETMPAARQQMRKTICEDRVPRAVRARALLMEAAPRWPGEQSGPWLRRCAVEAGLTERRAQGIYYLQAREISDDELAALEDAARQGPSRAAAYLRALADTMERKALELVSDNDGPRTRLDGRPAGRPSREREAGRRGLLGRRQEAS